jgi:hypothetical protein
LLAAGAHHAHGDLSAIGHKHLVDHVGNRRRGERPPFFPDTLTGVSTARSPSVLERPDGGIEERGVHDVLDGEGRLREPVFVPPRDL